MDWILISQILYVALIISVCLIVLFNTRSHNKTLAFILLVCFVPIVGIIIYFLIGFNFHKAKIFGNMEEENTELRKKLHLGSPPHDDLIEKYDSQLSASHKTLANFIHNSSHIPISENNEIEFCFPSCSKSLEFAAV